MSNARHDSPEFRDREPGAVTRTAACFGITGEFVTKHARALVVEENAQRGIKFLMDGLVGVTWDQAIAICEGSKCLVGWKQGPKGPGIEIMDQDPDDTAFKTYQSDLAYQHTGRFRVSGVWYKPYVALTGGWSSEDATGRYDGPSNPERLADGVRFRAAGFADSRKKEFGVRRALYYARKPGSDYLAVFPYTPQRDEKNPFFGHTLDCYVLCERVEAPPIWMPQYVKPADGFRAYLLAHEGRISEDGAAFRVCPGYEGAAVRLAMRALADHDGIPADTERNRKTQAEVRQQEDDARETAFLAKCTGYRKTIRAQAEAEDGLGYYTLVVERPEGDTRPTTYEVPIAPFDNWALGRTAARHLAPKWARVSPSGLKMMNDNTYHTDWMLGAEPPIPLNAWHGTQKHQDDPLKEASYKLNFSIAEDVAGFEVHVLCGEGQVSGTVVHPAEGQAVPEGSIIVIPHAGVEYEAAAMSAASGGAVICERGGRLAHLVTVGREQGLRILRIEDALATFPEGIRVEIDFDAGTLAILSDSLGAD